MGHNLAKIKPSVLRYMTSSVSVANLFEQETFQDVKSFIDIDLMISWLYMEIEHSLVMHQENGT